MTLRVRIAAQEPTMTAAGPSQEGRDDADGVERLFLERDFSPPRVDLNGKSVEEVVAAWMADNEATWKAWIAQ